MELVFSKRTRSNTSIGDVFSVKINDSQKKFFQLIAFDLTQLNSDVIRSFKKTYDLDESPDLSSIINDEVDFYTHCVTKLGLKMKLWEKVGNNDIVGETNNILFRGSSDSGVKKDNQLVTISNNWYVWYINDKTFTKVGKLEGDNREAELGIVVNPYDVIDRMKTGKFNFFYPSFE